MNDIAMLQVSEKQLARLRAQRNLYSRGKSLLALQLAISVPFAVLWALLGVFLPGSKPYAAFWGISVVILDVVLLTPWQKTLKSKAAKIQEAFDCDVLGLEWPSIKAGDKPLPEDITRWSMRSVGNENDSKLRDWYAPVVGQLPLPLARAICQRANCWWDAELRRRYARAAQALVASVFLLTLIIGLAGKFSIDQWLLNGIAPLLPVFTLGLRQASEQREAADRLDSLRRHAERIWAEILSGEPDDKVTQRSRELQDEIFDHRRRNPLIFDWIYNLLRSQQEELMNEGALALVEESRAPRAKSASS